MRAIQSLDETQGESLHYSSVITCSEEDTLKIKNALAKAIDEVRGIVKPSKDEAAFAYSLDFFPLKTV
jgi:hypothetical protein